MNWDLANERHTGLQRLALWPWDDIFTWSWRGVVALLLVLIWAQLTILNAPDLLARRDCASRWAGEVAVLVKEESGGLVCSRVDYGHRRKGG